MGIYSDKNNQVSLMIHLMLIGLGLKIFSFLLEFFNWEGPIMVPYFTTKP